MPSDEMMCAQHHALCHYTEFSKAQRKEDDPICMRCVAWNETQQYGVVPAPLATGHVSKEEETGEMWTKQYLVDTDYPDHATPQAPISSRAELGLSPDGPTTSDMLNQMVTRTGGLNVSESDSRSVVSSNTTQTSRVPPHIARRSAAASLATSDAASNSAASSAGPSNTSFIPPHLRKKPGIGGSGAASTASVSTATTIREAREQAKNDRATPFNAWDSQGNLAKKTHVPSTAASSDGTSVGRSSYTSSAKKWSSNFPRPPEQTRPARQMDINPPSKKKTNFAKPKKAGEEALEPEEWPQSRW